MDEIHLFFDLLLQVQKARFGTQMNLIRLSGHSLHMLGLRHDTAFSTFFLISFLILIDFHLPFALPDSLVYRLFSLRAIFSSDRTGNCFTRRTPDKFLILFSLSCCTTARFFLHCFPLQSRTSFQTFLSQSHTAFDVHDMMSLDSRLEKINCAGAWW